MHAGLLREFGGLAEAYRLIGYDFDRNLGHIARDRKYMMYAGGCHVRPPAPAAHRRPSPRIRLTVNGSIAVRTVVARCRPLGTSIRVAASAEFAGEP
jgi:hypothetical protein